MSSKLASRVKEYGAVGAYLRPLLDLEPWIIGKFSNGRFIERLAALRNATHLTASISPLLPAAISLLLLPFPLQVDLTSSNILTFFRGVFPNADNDFKERMPSVRDFMGPYRIMEVGKDMTFFIRRMLVDKEARHRFFPRKSHPGAYTKINVKLGALIKSARALHGPDKVARLLLACAGRVTEDQMAAALVYASGLDATFGFLGWVIAFTFITNPKEAKNFSVAMKSLGANSTPWGSLLVEAETLQGRGVGDIDIMEKARERCDPKWVAEHVIDVDPDDIRPHIRSVIERELRDRDVRVPPLHEFWSSRWLWCVNGSQTAASDRALGIDTNKLRSTHNRIYRRIAAEMTEKEPISGWDGTTYVSASPKLEHGKTRAIFACDTRSYFAFSWVLNTAQKFWRNERVLLDPGRGGHLGIVRRISHAQRGGGVNLMLDFDDFNSHHSSRVMAVVFEELCRILKMPEWYTSTIVGSFEKMYLSVDGQLSRVLGTLMSGHRGTTFINSILNAAYIRHAVGAAYFDKLLSLHTGDDVFVRVNNLADCEKILLSARLYGCRMNPSKQSVGYRGAEFLRMAIRGSDAYGYLARGVSSFVGGNWSNLEPTDPTDGIVTAIASTRTLINRSRDIRMAELVAPAIRYAHNLGVRELINLFSGRIGIQGQPVFNAGNRAVTLEPIRLPPDKVEIQRTWDRFATRDYLTAHVSPIESEALSLSGLDVTPLLVASSYNKGLNTADAQRKQRARFRTLPARPLHGNIYAHELLDRQYEKGVLTGYPLILLIKNSLSDDVLRQLVLEVGANPQGRDIRELAFGVESSTKNIVGHLSYADAAALSKRTDSGNIITNFQVYV